MNIWSNAVITEKGLNLEAKLIAGTTLTITKAQTGTGTVPVANLAAQTAVTSPQQTLSFRTASYPDTGVAAIPAYLSNDSLTTGYTATQVGIYAQDPDEGEILYFIAQANTGTGTEIPSNEEMPGFTAEWTFYLTYGQADSVTVTVNPANTVSQTQAQNLINAAIAAAQINASQIAEGILPVARGGTGNSSADTTPTSGSTKMVTSGGVYTAINSINAGSQIKSGVLPVARGGTGNSSVDTTPTSGSTKMVTSGGIYTALNTKQNKITSGTGTPSGGSNGDIYIQYS